MHIYKYVFNFYTNIYYTSMSSTDNKIDVSSNDSSIYRHIILDNKLEVVIIHDKDTDMSAATLSVGVGHYLDPPEYLGLAHFLEHMLFMGTKKYPNVNHYHEYLNNHGGSSNAYTAPENTSYFFDIQNDYILEALDIFGQFFIDPLFDKSTINKEVEAVDSEHSKNINSDGWRFQRMISKLVNKEHPSSKFSTGNLETLKKEGTYDNMIKFYKTHYSANIMKLCILSNKSVSELEPVVREIFGKVKNINYKHPTYNTLPFDLTSVPKDAICYKLSKQVPVVDTDIINIIWQLPNIRKYYLHKPTYYINRMLGHEGEGSIIYYLKSNNMATSLSSGIYETDETASINVLSIELTEDGFKNIPAIVDLVYYYIDLIDLIVKSGVDEWRYSEIKDVAKLNFKYLPKINSSDRVLSIADNMLHYPVKHCMSEPYIYKDYSEANSLISKYLEYFKRRSSVIIIASKKYEEVAVKREHYYGIQYIDKTFPTEYGSEFNITKLDTSSIHLPVKNIFMPTDITLHTPEIIHHYPKKIKLDDVSNIRNIEVWYKQDHKFKNPKVLINSIIYNKDISSTVTNYTMFILFIRLLNHSLTSVNYYSSLANLYFTISVNYEYLQISVNSYNNKDSISKILQTIIEHFSILPSVEVFKLVKTELKKDLENFIYNTPVELGQEYLKEKSYNKYYNYKAVLKELSNITSVDKLVSDVNKILSNSVIKMFICGNILEKDSLYIIPHFKKFLSTKSIDNFMPIIKVEKLLPGKLEVYNKDCYNPKEIDSAINVYYEISVLKKGFSKNWDIKLVLLFLINKITEEKFFTQLRSIEQSGYIVKSTIYSLGGSQCYTTGLLFFIQSYKKTLDSLEDRINSFMLDIMKFIKDLQNNTKLFEKYKTTIINELNKKDDNLYQEYDRNLNEIINGEYMFDYRKHLLSVVKNITVDQVIDYFDKYFTNKATRKVRIVKIHSKIKKN